MKLPTYVVEERKESFYCWHYMKNMGEIAPANNILVNADERIDLNAIFAGNDFLNQKMDLGMAHFFAYERLCNRDYLMPALLQKMFSIVVFIRKDVANNSHQYSRILLDDVGIIHAINVEPNNVQPVMNYEDRTVDVHFINGGMNNQYGVIPPFPMVLNIDLGFFACDYACRTASNNKVEITEEEYRRFLNNTYHVCRTEFPGCEVKKENNRFYLVFTRPQFGNNCSEENVVRNMDNFFRWLKTFQSAPAAIIISRSRITGYLPYWVFPKIENELLAGLDAVYGIDVKCRPSFDLP